MPRSTTAYASAHQKTRTHATSFVRGEVLSLAFDCNAVMASGATLSSVDWYTSNSSSVALGAETVGTRSTSVVVTIGYGPGAHVKCVATDSNGKKYAQLFEVSVESGPTFSGE